MNWTKSVANHTNAEKVMQLWELWLHTHTHTHTHQYHGFLSLVFTVGQNACGSRLGVVNPIILRNQRVEPAVHQCLLREEMNKKRGESCQTKKGQPKLLEPKNGDTT